MMDWLPLKDKYSGEPGLVIGNGPSLADTPLRYIQALPSFGANRIYLPHPEGDITPTFYASVNPLVLSQYWEQAHAALFNRGTSAFFVSALEATRPYLSRPEVFGLHSSPVPHFSREPGVSIYEGHTVTFVSLQIAFWMGFNPVYLVGVDHSYQTAEGTRPNQQVAGFADGDPNHYHVDYFGEGAVWHNPDLAASERAYGMAKAVYEADGREIINVTPGSSLSVFERQELEVLDAFAD